MHRGQKHEITHTIDHLSPRRRAIGVFLALGQGVLAERGTEGTLPLDDLRTFTEVFAKIKNDYVEPIEDKTLLENAIRGMLSGLDPHSTYLVPTDYQELQAGTSGEFGGLESRSAWRTGSSR